MDFGWPSTMPTPAIDRPGQGLLTNLSTGPHHSEQFWQVQAGKEFEYLEQVAWQVCLVARGRFPGYCSEQDGLDVRQAIGTRPRACACGSRF